MIRINMKKRILMVIQLIMIIDIGLEENIVKISFEKGNDFPYDTRTLFQRDYANVNKPDERDLLTGVILRLANKYNIDVTTTEKLYSIISEVKPQSLE